MTNSPKGSGLREIHSSQEFVKKIGERVQHGYGFVPFIGSGFSAPSGILMGNQFRCFLEYSIYQVLTGRCSIRKDGWPKYPSRQEVEAATQWFEKEQEHFQRAWSGTYASPWTQHSIVSDALAMRSRNDWRAMLGFLACVDIVPVRSDEGTVNYRVQRFDHSPLVVDSFNTHITRGKQPNLAHKMLAHLARPLRIRTILTTNFDRLVEEAFARLRMPLVSLPVSIRGALPHPHTVRAQNCIVKLHGEMLETRADYSLDDTPPNVDLGYFADYVSQKRHRIEKPSGRIPIPNDLIVLGYSGSDARCIKMIKYLLVHEPDVCVFWVGFNENDLKKLSLLFHEFDFSKRILAYKTTRPDLLLYELYQQLTLSLPGGGLAYEFANKVPPEPTPPREVDGVSAKARVGRRELVSQQLSNAIVEALDGPFNSKGLEELRPHAVLRQRVIPDSVHKGRAISVSAHSGVAAALQQAFVKFSAPPNARHCLWLELQDYANVSSLAQDILRSIAVRLGYYQLEHLMLLPGPKGTTVDPPVALQNDARTLQHLKLVKKCLDIRTEEWILFLYARNVPGGCSGWNNTPWCDEKSEVGRRDYEELDRLIDLLARIGFAVVYAPFTEERRLRDNEKMSFVANQCKEKLQAVVSADTSEARAFASFRFEPVGVSQLEAKHAYEKLDSFSIGGRNENSLFEELFEKVLLDWLEPVFAIATDSKKFIDGKTIDQRGAYSFAELIPRLRFLYATTLFRQSRHVSSFFTEAVYSCPERFNLRGIDNDVMRAEQVSQWIDDLRQQRVFYYKPGGYSWKHRDVRLGLQLFLQKIPLFAIDRTLLNGAKLYAFLGENRARTHFWIGDWYFKAFLATGHSTPLIECLYHRYQCARYARYARPRALSYAAEDKWSLTGYRLVLFQSAVVEMIKALRIARPRLKFWLASVYGDPMINGWKTSTQELSRALDEVYEQPNGDNSVRPSGEAAPASERKSGKVKPTVHTESGFADNSESPSREDLNAMADHIRKLIAHCAYELRSLQTALTSEGGLSQNRLFVRPEFPDIPRQEREASERPVVFRVEHDNWEEDYRDRFVELKAVHFVTMLKNYYESTEDVEIVRRSLSDQLNKCKAIWLLKSKNDALTIYRFVNLVTDTAYLHLRRAKLEQYSGQGSEVDGIDSGIMLRRRWVQVTVLCYMGIDLCKHLHPSFLQDELRIKGELHAIYGLALAYLDRFSEAHRHLNEASGVLSQRATTGNSEDLAVVRLRRAETYLTESDRVATVLGCVEQLRDATPTLEMLLNRHCLTLYPRPKQSKKSSFSVCVQEPIRTMAERIDGEQLSKVDQRDGTCRLLSRRHAALLDDAWAMLESAELLMAGNTQSSLWFGRLAALKLRAFGAIREAPDGRRYAPLAFRSRIQSGEQVERLLGRGLLMSQHDPYRRLRFIDYANSACCALGIASTQEPSTERLKSLLDELNEVELPSLLRRYQKRVSDGLDASAKRRPSSN